MGLFVPDFRSMERHKDVEGLIEYLKNDSNDLRFKSCEALGKVGDNRAIQPIIDMLNEKKMQDLSSKELREVRSSAICTIYELYIRGEGKDQKIIKVLVNELNHPLTALYIGSDSCYEAISSLMKINNIDTKKVLISIAYDYRYIAYMDTLGKYVKDLWFDAELRPIINETKQKLSESTKKVISSHFLSKFLPDQTLNAFSIATYTPEMAATVMAVTAVAKAALGPIGKIIVGGRLDVDYKSGLIGCSDKEFFFIDFNPPSIDTQNGFARFATNLTYKFIKRAPLKELKVEYNEVNGDFLVTGALSLRFIIGDYFNYLNSENAHFIVNAIKNDQNIHETSNQEKIPDSTKEITQKQHPEIAVSRSVGLEKKQVSPNVIPTNNYTELRDKQDDQKAQGKAGSERDPLSGHYGPLQGLTEPPVISEKDPMKETTHSQKYLIIGGVGTALLILSFFIPYSHDKLDVMSPYYNLFGVIFSNWGSDPFILLFYLILIPWVIGIVGSIVGLYLSSYKILMVAGIVSIIIPINIIILVEWGTLQILWVIMSILGSILLIISGLITRSNIQSITSS